MRLRSTIVSPKYRRCLNRIWYSIQILMILTLGEANVITEHGCTCEFPYTFGGKVYRECTNAGPEITYGGSSSFWCHTGITCGNSYVPADKPFTDAKCCWDSCKEEKNDSSVSTVTLVIIGLIGGVVGGICLLYCCSIAFSKGSTVQPVANPRGIQLQHLSQGSHSQGGFVMAREVNEENSQGTIIQAQQERDLLPGSFPIPLASVTRSQN